MYTGNYTGNNTENYTAVKKFVRNTIAVFFGRCMVNFLSFLTNKMFTDFFLSFSSNKIFVRFIFLPLDNL